MLERTRSARSQNRIRFTDGTPALFSKTASRSRARQLLLWGLLLVSLLLYCAGRFLKAPQPHAATVAPAKPRLSAPPQTPTPESPALNAAFTAPVPVPPPEAPASSHLSETAPAALPEPVPPAEPDASAPSAVLARELDAQRTAESRWPKLFGVRVDEGSTLGLGRFQFGYGRWLADPPAGLNSRNGTALEEPGCLYVKLHVRF